MTRIWFALLVSGCVASESTPCSDGRVCPEGTTCAEVAERPMCVSAEQLESCESVDAFGACGDGMRCYDGVCLPSGCANAIRDPEEECDDGNLTPGDTCSATCLVERCGNGAIDLVLGEECDDGAAGVSGDGCSSTCKSEVLGWHDISPAPFGARQAVAMVYDDARDVVIAFGGLGPATTHGDTWMWDRTKWTRLHPPVSPGPRWSHAMAYDPVRERVVLVGGYDLANKTLEDTWEWDGVTWEQKLVTTPRTVDSQITYVPSLAKIVLVPAYSDVTYAWDGTTWTTIGSAPPTDYTVPLGFDAAHGQLLACGTKNLNACVTYVFNGTSWTEVATATTRPNTVSGGRMAYDSARGKLVLYGGHGQGAGNPLFIEDIWEWSGTNWVVATPSTKPAGRGRAGLAFDGAQLVMFGGTTAGATLVADTWRWNGSAWTLLAPPVNPAGRYDAASACDRRHGRCLVFGGVGTAQYNDTWEWTGTDWRQLLAGTPPAGHRGASLAYDLQRRHYVLFGGGTNTGTEFDETWHFAGTAWEKITIAGARPAARTYGAMAFDEARGVTLLFGGRDANFMAIGDTWTYDGTTWTSHTPATAPSARSDVAIGYDSKRERVVMFGGGGFPPSDETWEWDGANWSLVMPSVKPPARLYAQLTYDPLLGGMVLTGGRTSNGGQILDDVWLWDGTTWASLTVQNRPDPRFAAATFFDPMQRGIVTFGGRLNATYSMATLVLRYAALAAPESCGLADEDRDGDTLKGCADPDCWGRCKPLCPPSSSCPSDENCGDGLCSSVEDYLICPADCAP